MAAGELRIKRIYDERSDDDGYRVLVDRLWPRGIKKEAAALDEWAKDVTPSTKLRKWFGHRDDRFEEFAGAYREELDASEKAHAFVEKCAGILRDQNVTLLYGAKSRTVNHAVILRDWLLKNM